MDRRGFIRNAALLGTAALVPSRAVAVFGGLERALHEPVALARVNAGARINEIAATFDLTEHGRDGWYDIVLHPGDRARLEAAGFTYEVLIDDLVARDLADREAERVAQAANPSERLLYRTYADYVADLQRLATDHPSLATLIELPHRTHEGRAVYAIEIAAGNADDGRPGVYIDGIHHAREWPSGEYTMMFAEDLVHSYVAGDPRVSNVLNRTRVLIVPVVNPDGFVRSRETVSDFIAPAPGVAAFGGELAYHRKNMRKNSSMPLAEPGQGVDPNRNYPFHWGGGGADTASNGGTYRGPGPGSEPEIQNILWLLRSRQVQTMISNHTYGNLILRPWGDTWNDSPDEEILAALGDAMAEENGYDSIKGIGLYVTTGTADDWFYGVTGGLGYTFEHGTSGLVGLGNTGPHENAGFHPQYNLNIPAVYARNRGPFLILAEGALDETTHCVIEGSAPAGSTLVLEKTALAPYGTFVEWKREYTEVHRYTLTVPPSGAYKWHVNPSPLPETIAAVAAGRKPASARERYTLTCEVGGTPVGSASVLALRGNRYTVSF